MTLDELHRAIATIEPPDGDGYTVKVYLRSGHEFSGAHYHPEGGLLRLDPTPINSDLPPVVVAIADIVAIAGEKD